MLLRQKKFCRAGGCSHLRCPASNQCDHIFHQTNSLQLPSTMASPGSCTATADVCWGLVAGSITLLAICLLQATILQGYPLDQLGKSCLQGSTKVRYCSSEAQFESAGVWSFPRRTLLSFITHPFISGYLKESAHKVMDYGAISIVT